MIKMCFINQGLLLGDFEESNEDYYLVKNPVLVITRQDGVAFAPILQLAEEDHFFLDKDDIKFNKDLFTPKTQIINSYNQIYGAGIQISDNILSL